MRKFKLTPKSQSIEEKPVCNHVWKRFKQTINVDNVNFKHIGAHFVLKACEHCRTKVYIDYKVER